MTKLKTFDKRNYSEPTFSDLAVGDIFTDIDNEILYIKIETIYDQYKTPYNTVCFDGDLFFTSPEEEVQPVKSIEITIKE